MLTATEDPDLDVLDQGEVAALGGVRQFPARVKCTTLAWHAPEKALGGVRRRRAGVEGSVESALLL